MLRIAGQAYNPRLVVFDKDGTLIAFHVMWQAWFGALMDALRRRVTLDEAAEQDLLETLGVNESGEWDPMGPLTLASTGEINILLAGVLYRHAGCSWPVALDHVAAAESDARAVLDRDDLVQPVGDLAGLIHALRRAGVRLAIATTDNRAPTEAHLRQLGIADCFEALVCGDDGIPLKPAPDMALHLCEQLGIPPGDAIMVGDTVADLEMGRRAGFEASIAVTSGALSADMLADHADAVIPDIHAIEIVAAEVNE
jgi:phosphoglycolate phosphatase